MLAGHWSDPRSLLRFPVGGIFLVTGLLKLADPGGTAGQFAALGLPFPGGLALVVGGLEALCGLLLVAGRYVRLAVVPLILIMVGALLFARFPVIGKEGWVPAFRGARLDILLLFVSLYLWMVEPRGR